MSSIDLLFEAEVSPTMRKKFESKYKRWTGIVVSPGSPKEYQEQSNKWGMELRVYFNDDNLARILRVFGVRVEARRNGYKSQQYKYRFSDNKL